MTFAQKLKSQNLFEETNGSVDETSNDATSVDNG